MKPANPKVFPVPEELLGPVPSVGLDEWCEAWREFDKQVCRYAVEFTLPYLDGMGIEPAPSLAQAQSWRDFCFSLDTSLGRLTYEQPAPALLSDLIHGLLEFGFANPYATPERRPAILIRHLSLAYDTNTVAHLIPAGYQEAVALAQCWCDEDQTYNTTPQGFYY